METLIAVGTLAIGLLFIAGTFVAGVHFSALTTERTIAAVAAEEAFAKIRLYGLDAGDPNLAADKMERFESLLAIDPNEFAYPSIRSDPAYKQYDWSAICRLVASGSRLVQLTVFVTRASAPAASYQGGTGRPIPMQVEVSADATSSQLRIQKLDEQNWINDGYRIVDDKTGQIYRVLERLADTPDTIVLDGPWQGATTGGAVWVVPPPATGGRNPCVGVYQKVVRF
jgi:hypothetical protein